MLTVALIGYGGMGKMHGKCYAALKDLVKLVAVAYSGNKMIDVAILPLGMLPANKPSEVNYSFTNLEGLTHIKVLAWESFANMYPYCKAFTK